MSAPEAFGQHIRDEIAKWIKVAWATKVQQD